MDHRLLRSRAKSRSTGPPATPRPAIMAESAAATIFTATACSRSDPDTGKLKWYFQFTPHDLYDYDATQVPVLLDAEWEGQPRKLLVQANRNGFLYVLDRTDGKFLNATAFGKVTWATSIAKDGRPVINNRI